MNNLNTNLLNRFDRLTNTELETTKGGFNPVWWALKLGSYEVSTGLWQDPTHQHA
jgi:hypothetical protein